MATPVAMKPWRAVYKKSPEIVQCSTCLSAIAQGSFALINVLPDFRASYKLIWHHATCILQVTKRIRESKHGRVVFLDNRKIRDWNNVEGAKNHLPRNWDRLRNYIQEEDLVGEHEVVKAKNSQSACECCKKRFDKGQTMIQTIRATLDTKAVGDGQFQLSLHLQWHHSKCFFDEYPQAEVSGYTCPPPLEAPAPVRAPSSSSVRVVAPAFGLLEPGRGKKRDGGRERMDDETSNKRQKKSVNQASVVAEPLGKFEQQRKDLLELEGELRERVTVEELKDILCANDQDTTGSEDELLERCADGMMFGALSRCPECSGKMKFQLQGSYWCQGGERPLQNQKTRKTYRTVVLRKGL